jgi:hypothetical protein
MPDGGRGSPIPGSSPYSPGRGFEPVGPGRSPGVGIGRSPAMPWALPVCALGRSPSIPESGDQSPVDPRKWECVGIDPRSLARDAQEHRKRLVLLLRVEARTSEIRASGPRLYSSTSDPRGLYTSCTRTFASPSPARTNLDDKQPEQDYTLPKRSRGSRGSVRWGVPTAVSDGPRAGRPTASQASRRGIGALRGPQGCAGTQKRRPGRRRWDATGEKRELVVGHANRDVPRVLAEEPGRFGGGPGEFVQVGQAPPAFHVEGQRALAAVVDGRDDDADPGR